MALWVLVGMVFTVPLAFWSVSHIDLQNDVTNWLPFDDPEARTLRWYKEHFGVDDRLILSWKGSSLNDPRIARLQTMLLGPELNDGTRRGGVKYVENVITPHEVVDKMVGQGVERQEAIRRLTGILIGRGPLCVRLTDSGRERKQQTIADLVARAKAEWNLEVTAEDAIPLWEMDAQSEEAWDDENLTEEELARLDAAEEQLSWFEEREHDIQLTWRGIHRDPESVEHVRSLLASLRGRRTGQAVTGEVLVAETFFNPGAPVAVAVTLSPAGAAETADALAAIKSAAEQVGIRSQSLHLGGRPVAGQELNEGVKRAAWDPTAAISRLDKRSVILLSGIVSVALAFFLLKSIRLAVLMLAAAGYTTLLALAAVPATNGSMNMVLVVMPTLLSVLTISAGIHVVNYWKHAAHVDLRTAVVESVKMAAKPCILASFTTAIGLLSLATSPLSPVRSFGLYSALGCLISLLVVLLVLPALLQFWPARRSSPTSRDYGIWLLLTHWIVKFRTPVILGSIALFAVTTAGLRWFRTETKVIRYFPADSTVVKDYHFLEDNLTGIIPVESIIRFDESAQKDLNFLERMEVVRAIEEKMRQHPQVSGTMSLADFQPASQPPGEDASFPRKARYHKKASVIENRVKEGNQRETSSLLAASLAGSSLHADGDRQLSGQGDELWRITAQVSVMSEHNDQQITRDLNEIAQSELKYHAGTHHVVTGMVPVFLRTQQAVLESLILSFALAFGVIAVVMAILLKSPLAGALTMLPNVFPIAVVFGLISWNMVAIDIGTMITASVALGIAVDGTLHLLTWFQSGVAQGKSRRAAIANAMAHCGPAMWQTSAVVGVGLLMLYPAELLLISRFGWLMAALIGAALVADLVCLPALLAGPLGALIEKSVAQQQASMQKEYVPHGRSMHIPQVSSPVAQNRTVDAAARRVVRVD
jgi:predicted RND superfamily exporter protein